MYRILDIMEYRAGQGLWNGGTPFLGYDFNPDEEIPKVIEDEARIVKEIFQSYLEKTSASTVATLMNNKGYRNKRWMNKKGETRGEGKFTKFNILPLLDSEKFFVTH